MGYYNKTILKYNVSRYFLANVLFVYKLIGCNRGRAIGNELHKVGPATTFVRKLDSTAYNISNSCYLIISSKIHVQKILDYMAWFYI